jgi:hypothetical protein
MKLPSSPEMCSCGCGGLIPYTPISPPYLVACGCGILIPSWDVRDRGLTLDHCIHTKVEEPE